MIQTLLDTVNACDIQIGDYVSILGITEGMVVGTEDISLFEVVLIIQDEDEMGGIERHTLDPFDQIDILGY